MTDALRVVSTETAVSTGVRDPKVIADALANVLSDTYRLVFKTHAYHWNIEGPLFFSAHKLTEEQYENMFAAVDELAERIRALGQLAPATLHEVMSRSRIEDRTTEMTALEMIADLAADHERIAHRLHALTEMTGGRKDVVTEDLATARSAFHEKAAWMLRALAKS